MLALKPFRSTADGVADLLNWGALIEDGVVQCKSGCLLAGWYFRGRDIASSTDSERDGITARVNGALSRLGAGWASWVEAVRMSASGYPPASASHFPDAISRLVDAERRVRFEAEGVHFENTYALVVQFTPPLRRKSRVVDLIYDDDAVDRITPASRILQQFQKALADLEDTIGDVVQLDRMASYVVTDRFGVEHFRDELVNFLHFTLTGEPTELNIPPAGAYLDAVLGGRELWPGDTPLLGERFIGCITLEAFPAESYSGILDVLDHLAIPYRWSSRFIYLDHHEAKQALGQYRQKWKQQVRGFVAQLFKTQGGSVNEDAVLMVQQSDDALSEASSGLVAFGYYTPVIVLMDRDRTALAENARVVVRAIQREGFTARVETINTMEAWLGSLPGHPVPNVRRPLIHTEHLAHLLPLASVWTGRDVNPCPLYPPASPPLLYAATSGATPMRLNLHVSDVGHTLVFGPIGSGKTVLLATVAIQALRYPGVVIWSFDYKRGMLATVKACGGQHYDIGREGGPAFCPLGELDGDGDLAWAEDWIASCFELQEGSPPTPGQRDAIHRAMLLLQADKAPGARSMTHFVTTLQDEEIRGALRTYTLEGALGGMLDAEADSIAYGRLMAFEMEDLLALKEQASIPVLLYLFRRFEKSLKGQPTFLILDEAWVVLGHPVFRAKLATWLRITRSKNCAVIMATQILSDANKSGILDVLLESCPTKIFLPNEEAETSGAAGVPGPRDFYEAMGLNEKQIGIIRHAVRKRHYYLTQPEGRRLFELNLGPIALAFSGATSEDAVAEVNQFERTHGERWALAWLDAKGIAYEHLL